MARWEVCFREHNRLIVLNVSFSDFDPYVWSGRA